MMIVIIRSRYRSNVGVMFVTFSSMEGAQKCIQEYRLTPPKPRMDSVCEDTIGDFNDTENGVKNWSQMYIKSCHVVF